MSRVEQCVFDSTGEPCFRPGRLQTLFLDRFDDGVDETRVNALDWFSLSGRSSVDEAGFAVLSIAFDPSFEGPEGDWLLVGGFRLVELLGLALDLDVEELIGTLFRPWGAAAERSPGCHLEDVCFAFE
ncbi:hypothetical protein [Leifsonia sp. Root227]|uniref:hypothetical protein n=1 Tax=Leifsonia sp. Root227 TaxID=1736496 RepID=UPI00138F8ECC|nr:hypothetical protein [Leifsonia sp. Root227]